MIALDILTDALFAAIAGIGFGAISNPPRRVFPYVALLAAIGHATRFSLITYLGIEIATASLAAAILIGFGSLWFGRIVHSPSTVLCIPALLPMIPGKLAYNMVFSLIMFLQSANEPAAKEKYMEIFFSNSITVGTVIFLLAVGAIFPIILFPKRASSLTRGRII